MQSVTGFHHFQVDAKDTPPADGNMRLAALTDSNGKLLEIQLQPPAKAPSSFASFLGSVIGPSTQEVQLQTALALFRQTLTEEFGKEIASFTTKHLKGHLTVGDVHQVRASAMTMKEKVDRDRADENIGPIASKLAAKAAALPAQSDSLGFAKVTPGYAMCQLLVRIALGPRLHQEHLTQHDKQSAVDKGIDLLNKLRAAEGMSEPEAMQLLAFAAGSGRNPKAAEVLEDLLLPLGSDNRGTLGDRAVVAGSSIEAYVPTGFNARAISTRGEWNTHIADGKAEGAHSDQVATSIHDLHAKMVRLVETPQSDDTLAELSTKDGQVFQISKKVLTDGHRLDAVVQGHVLDREQEGLVPAAIRGALPAGAKGDAMCLLAGNLIPQETTNAQNFYVVGNTFKPAQRETSPIARTLYVRPDGMLVVRGTQTQTVKSVVDPTTFEGTKDLVPPARVLQRQEFVVAPGAPGQAPHILSVSTDVLFN